MTTDDLLVQALRRFNVVGIGETPSSDEQSAALTVLNALTDNWQNEGLTAYCQLRTTWTITSGTSTYTVGTGATINVARPPQSNDVVVRFQDTSVSPTQEYPLVPLTDQAYEQLAVKSQTGTYPMYAYYNPTFTSGFGTVILWPTPTSATLQGVLYTRQVLGAFTLGATITLPPGAQRALETNLALELHPNYGKQPNPELVRQAVESKADFKRANSRLIDLPVDPAVTYPGRPYGNIYTGTPS